jgi:hypothetical protein
VRRLPVRHEDDAIQLELEVRFLREDQVTEVRRVERSAEDSDP